MVSILVSSSSRRLQFFTTVALGCALLLFVLSFFASPEDVSISWIWAGAQTSLVLVSLFTALLARLAQQSQKVALESQKKVAFERERQQHLIDDLTDGIIITDYEGTVTVVNKAARTVFAVSLESFQGKRIEDELKKFFSNFAPSRTFQSHRVHDINLHAIHENFPKITYQERPVFDGTENLIGWMYVFKDVTRIRSIEEQLSLQERMAQLLTRQDEPPIAHTKILDFVGESAVMQRIFELIARVAPSDATTLICGESGTGKELVARAIHLGSTRSDEKFVTVNCGAIPENLLESELFGSKKGAYTGSVSDRIGLFVEAHEGTLFLDEIGELPLHLQVKLLRVLQEKTVRPVGGSHDVPIDVRIIAATNKNLKKEVAEGRFREDLFYRLNVIMIQVPALRERKEDIPCLVNNILKGLSKNKAPILVTPQAMQQLVNYDYPGNVRELENVLERAIVLGGEAILPEHLPDTLKKQRRASMQQEITEIIELSDIALPAELDKILDSIEKKYLEAALQQTSGAKKKAADLLGVNFRSFRYRLQKFGMQGDDTPVK